MKLYYSILLTFCVFIFWFCSSQKHDWRKDFRKISVDSLFRNNHDNWELSTKEEYFNSVFYTIRKRDGDTLKVLSFFNNMSNLSVKEYFKRYPTDTGDTCYLEMTSQDTLFFYKRNDGVKTFEVGEYGYRYTSMLFEDYELAYYLKHEDSLRRVRGNKLPKLPRK